MFVHCGSGWTSLRSRPGPRATLSRVMLLVVVIVAGALLAHSSAQESENLKREAQSQAAGGHWNEAAATLERAAALSPHDSDLQESLAFAEVETGQLAAAISSYQAALKLSPRNVSAEVGLAQAYRRAHNYDQARSILNRAIREHPKDPRPLAVFGDFDIEMQTYDAAIGHLRAALALAPSNVETRNRLAVAYSSKGDIANALVEIRKVLARDPANALAYYTRAQIYSDSNQDEPARRDAEKVVELQPQNPRGRALLGEILLRMPPGASASDVTRQCTRAVGVLEPLFSVQSNDSKTLYLLARAYRCAGQTDQAQKTLQEFEAASQNDRATKENQTQAKHLVEQSDALAIKNDFQGALDLLQQALAKDPTYGVAYSQLAKLYYSAGDIEKASGAIEQALSRNPYQPEFLYVQGKILEKQGKPDDALAAFQRATLIDPKESDAYFEMGTIYQQRNERARALAAYKKALDLSPNDPDYQRALDAFSRNAPPER